MAIKNSTTPSSHAGFQLEVIFDPVCGEEIEAPAAAPTVTKNNQQFYFCSDRCKTRFLLEPQRYAVSSIEIK